jgi:hypothetical protein
MKWGGSGTCASRSANATQTSEENLAYSFATYHWHLLPFGASIFMVPEALRHDFLVAKTPPQ